MLCIFDSEKLSKCFVKEMTEEKANEILEEYKDFPYIPAYYQALVFKQEKGC